MQLHHYQLKVPNNPSDFAAGRQTLVVTAVDTEYVEICSAVIEYGRGVTPPGPQSAGMFKVPNINHTVHLYSLVVYLPDDLAPDLLPQYEAIGYNCALAAIDALRHHVPGPVVFKFEGRNWNEATADSYKVGNRELPLKDGLVDPDFLDGELNRFDAEMVDPSMIVWSGTNRVTFHPLGKSPLDYRVPPYTHRPDLEEINVLAAPGKVTGDEPSWAGPAVGKPVRKDFHDRLKSGRDLIAITYRRLTDHGIAMVTNQAYRVCEELEAMSDQHIGLVARAGKLLDAEQVLGDSASETIKEEMVKFRTELMKQADELLEKIHDQCHKLEVKVRIAFEHPAPEPETPAAPPVQDPAVGDAAEVQTPPAE